MTPENVVLRWNTVMLEAIRRTHPGPPMVARIVAMTHTAMYNAWAAYSPKSLSTLNGGSLRRTIQERTLENKEKAMSFAAYRVLHDLFDFPSVSAAADVVAEVPIVQGIFSGLMSTLGYDPNETTLNVLSPQGIGNREAADLLAVRHVDGSNQLNRYADTSGYVPLNTPTTINDPNAWQPLSIGGAAQKYIAPHWGGVTGFALKGSNQFPVPAPFMHPSKEYNDQAEEVVAYSANLTDKQKVIAEYWADGPSSELPPGHWTIFARYVSLRDDHSLDTDIKMFFALGNAILDASIASWAAKRAYNFVRPVTAIHFVFKNMNVRAWSGPYKGANTILGQDWRPYQAANVVTPPFPEQLSGHSTFSAAAAAVLRQFKGRDDFGMSVTIPSGSSRVEPGSVPAADVVLSWRTFTDAANEAGISRLYGGIHFERANTDGLALGKLVGEQAFTVAESFYNGTALV